MLGLMFIFLFVVGTAAQDGSRACPINCSCIPGTVRCINVRLKKIPTQNIPPDTIVLDLRYNNIKEIKKDDFQSLENLENLFLGNNLISSIEPNAFGNLRKLKNLYLFSNKLKKIAGDTFNGLPNLEQLYLQNNGINEISPNAFRRLRKLHRLYLHRNRLKYISQDTLLPLRTLRRLRISTNRIKCSCSFLRLVKQFTFVNDVYVGATCNYLGREQQTNIMKYSDLGCYKPKFLTAPSKQVAFDGSNVQIDCEADGNPRPVTSWTLDGVPIPSNIKHKQHLNGTLSIYNLNQDSTGYYQCTIENEIGKRSSGATVGIISENVFPVFTEKPSDIDAIAESTILFNCRASGFPRPKITWSLRGQLITSTQRYNLLPSGDLEISSLKVSDAGVYTCRAENNIGSVVHRAALSVQAPPRFVKTPSNKRVFAGSNVDFRCKATGFPQPAISWSKDGKRLPSDGRHIILPSGELRILYTRKENEGLYECQAFNVIGVVAVQANLSIKALVEPEITERPSDITVQSGNTIAFRCIATGEPNPVITWTRNDVQITNGSRFTISSKDGTIEIKDIGKIDEGRWQCHARNTIGYQQATFSLNVIGPKNGVFEGDRFVLESIEKARSEVDRAIEQTKQKLRNFRPRTPADLLALFRFPSSDALEIARSAEIFEVAIDIIQKSVDNGLMLKEMKQKFKFNGLVSPDQVRLLANLSGCTAHKRVINCSNLCFHQNYRTYDGSCNNYNHPMWGASLTPFSRLLIPNYENGFNTPYGWSKTKLPSARKVSLSLISSVKVTSDVEYTHMLMQWGQFLDHDMDFTVTSPSSLRFNDGLSCKDTCENEQPCFPIKIEEDDPRIKRYQCMEFTRSSAVCGSGSTSVFFDSITPRQQINQITSFIDASNVYGSSKKDAEDLRVLENNKGLLKRGVHHKNGNYFLPFNQDTPIDCQVGPNENRVPCFLAGDHRANEQLGLLSMHTLWMRQHNRIAREFHRINPHWTGEKVYQETRKIVGAQMQHISYVEWLPKILGKKGMEKFGDYTGYDPYVEPSIFNSFATAAFRFGHTLIQPIMARLNASFKDIPEESLPLHKAFFSPYRLVEEGGIDPLLRGLFGTPVKSRKATHQPFNTELTEKLFEMAHTVALDLAALNIQRGRDHGLPTYNSWRQYCNLSVAQNFDDIKEIRNKTLRKRLSEVYKEVNQIDLFVGGILEDPLEGSRLGPTFMCLISLQFKRLRSGDRFWYENPSVFTPNQLTQIKQTTLARVICDNSDSIRNVQYDVFKRAEQNSDYVPCNQHKQVDLRYWKECCTGESCSRNDQTNTVSNLIRIKRGEQQSLRSRRSEIPTPLFNITSTKDDPARPETNNKRTDKSIRNRMNYVERNMKKAFRILRKMEAEMEILRKELNTVDVSKNRVRDCIENGLVREHNEEWFNQKNQKCVCKDFVITCS